MDQTPVNRSLLPPDYMSHREQRLRQKLADELSGKSQSELEQLAADPSSGSRALVAKELLLERATESQIAQELAGLDTASLIALAQEAGDDFKHRKARELSEKHQLQQLPTLGIADLERAVNESSGAVFQEARKLLLERCHERLGALSPTELATIALERVNDSLHAEALTRWLRDEDAAVEVLRSCNIAELKDLKANHPNVLVRGLASKVVSEREPKPPPVIRNEGKKPVVIIPPKPESKITPKPDDRRTETVSIEHAIAKFKANYPKGFSDPLYGQLERDYKVKAHEKWMETLNEEEFKKLLTARDYAEIVNRALRVEATIKRTMLHRTQKMALHDAVQQPGDAKLFAKGLYDLIYGGDNDKARFEYFATVLGRLPHDKSAVLCWPVQTIFLFVALPKKHIFVKPNVTKDAAEWSGVSLNYKPRPNWTTYSCVLTLANKLKTALADLEPRDLDMIDIQSFIWATQYEAS